MELSKITSGTSIYGSSAISERIASASQKPLERLSQQAESTRVQLSAFGQVKSATVQVEATAKKLQDNKNLGSATDAAKAAQGFADAFNDQARKVRQASGDNPRAANELRRAVEGIGGSNRDSLKQIGITVSQDGSLKVDAKALEKAYAANPDQVRNTLNSTGKAAAETSEKQLAGNGAVGAPMSRLTEKLGNVEQKKADYQARLEQSQKLVQDQERRTIQARIATQEAFSFNGIGAYNRVFSS